MPRSRVSLVVVAAVLLVAAGGYTGFWLVAAGRIEDEVARAAAGLPAQNVTATWQAMRVAGFPLALRVELEAVQVRAAAPAAELRAPVLTASARPWNFRDWQIEAPGGVEATAGAIPAGLGKLAARAATGAVAVPPEGGAAVWLTLREPSAGANLPLPVTLTARALDLWLIVPAAAPRQHADRNIALAADLHELSLPVAPKPFGRVVEDLAFGVAVMGEVPGGRLRDAAEAWRRSGGTVELDHFRLRWDAVGVSGSGTLALDNDLQPVGGFSGAIEGFEPLLAALVSAGQIREGDARLARLALAMMVRPGPEGRPQIATSFAIQNGDLYLGPAKLGRAPRINWE